MKLTQYFLIAPLPQVTERLKSNSVSPEFESIARPVLWSAGEHDKGTLSHTDLDSLVKLLFLDVLQREQGAGEKFSAVFPGFIVAESFFDLNWSATRVALDMTTEDALDDAIASRSIESWTPTGNERIDTVLGQRRG